jgi:hypothetical protein
VVVVEVVVILVGVIVALVLADLAIGGIRKRWRRRRDGASRR